MSWLPKEIIRHLDHAGYVAVPKDRIETVSSELVVDAFDMMASGMTDAGLLKYRAGHLANMIGHALLKEGFIAIEGCKADDNGNVRTLAQVIVLRPKLIVP